MTNSKQLYLGIGCGLMFLFTISVITFIIIGINKNTPLFDNVANAIGLAFSLLLLLTGSVFSFYQAFKNG